MEVGAREFILLVITSTDKAVIAQFEEEYPSHTSRCVLAKAADLDPKFAETLPFDVEVRRFEGCKSTDELDSWMEDVMNTPYRKIFNVSDWSYFAYVSAETGQVQAYIPEPDDDFCKTTAPNSPCDGNAGVAPSSSASSSAASSVTSTPEKKKTKSRKHLKRQSEEEDDDCMASVIPSETSSVVSQLRKKVSKLDLTDRTLC